MKVSSTLLLKVAEHSSFLGLVEKQKNPLEAGRYIHRCVKFHYFRLHGLCSCLIAETRVRNLFSGKEEILSVPYWD